MADDKELGELLDVRRRLDYVVAFLNGKSKSEIAREYGTSPSTVRLWVKRFQTEGIHGLLTKKPTGRPTEIHPVVRSELVRLARDTRPPPDLGEQWSARLLAEAFPIPISPAYVSKAWRDEGFDPPQHLQQVRRNPDRDVPLRFETDVPAWYKLHLELAASEEGCSVWWLLWDIIMGRDHHLEEMREDVFSSLPERYEKAMRDVPIEDPRRPEYWEILKQQVDDEN